MNIHAVLSVLIDKLLSSMCEQMQLRALETFSAAAMADLCAEESVLLSAKKRRIDDGDSLVTISGS